MERVSGTALEAIAVVLLVTAGCDALGLHSASFLALVLGVPVVAWAGLTALAGVIDQDRGRLQVALAAILLAVVLFGAAVRSPAVAATGIPPAATVALVAAFLVLLLQSLAEAPKDVGAHGPLLSLDP